MAIPTATRSERLKVVFRSTTFWVGFAIVLMWIVFAIFGDFITPYDPLDSDVINRLKPPSAEHWFGTDDLGRDVLSRVLAGARQVLTVALAATVLGTILGTVVGLIIGYFGGIVDESISRILDAFLSIPLVITGMLALAALGPNTIGVVVVIGLVFTPIIAKTVRAAVLSERQLDYVTAAQLRKENWFYILFVEILKELPATLILRPFDFDTLAVKAYSYASDERLLEAAAPALLIFAAGLAPMLLLSGAIGRMRTGGAAAH